MSNHYDAIVVGAGPAGSTAAIRLAQAGWSVALVEKRAFPRRKVCGECIAATNLPLLDALGVGAAFDAIAGPPLQRVGLFVGEREIHANLPPLAGARQPWGRALGREHLDTLLLQRAQALGVTVWQPWSARRLLSDDGQHICELTRPGTTDSAQLHAPVLIEAHGSWEPDPENAQDATRIAPSPHRGSDLFAFKGTYRNARIAPGLLPVLAFDGGYGGMVLGDHGLTTLAFCIRRDALRERRDDAPGQPAAQAALSYLQRHCDGVRRALVDAESVDRWLSVGPLQPGVRGPLRAGGAFAVGNVAGEAHPILGEGISMAIQSSWLLCNRLLAAGARDDLHATGRAYARDWHRSFVPRIRFAAVCAQLAMRPRAASALLPLLQRWPALLTAGARIAGKVRPLATGSGSPLQDVHPSGVPR